MYENQKIIDKENEKLKNISPDLKIGSTVIYRNQITSIGISIPIKGNAKKIKQLEADGWKKTYRQKCLGDYGGAFGGNKYSGYSMMQFMIKKVDEIQNNG